MSSSDVTIRSKDDWRMLQDNLQSGKRIERVIVSPSDPDLVRDRQFAEGLGSLAATKNFVIELAGGILSHVYYILQRNKAHVECTDLYGDDEEIIEFDKLVRDKVPFLIEKRGERVEIAQLKGDALVSGLRSKLVEEAFEAMDSRSLEELVGEIADIEEVIRGLSKALHFMDSDIKRETRQKRRSRGGFDAEALCSLRRLPLIQFIGPTTNKWRL
jgi:predicted house-cleaning noncanonical NTP pyrophosphatase (MazG superfamily)